MLRLLPLDNASNIPISSMPIDDSAQQARRILNAIAFSPFDRCQPLNRGFEHIPPRPGIYAIRHRTEGLLYVGKTKSLRGRFSGGHKAFLWAWLDKYDDEDVRIAIQLISHWENPTLLLELEAVILRATLQRPNPHGAINNACQTPGATFRR
jgi:GIY-YIG catalytic domain